MGPADIVRYGKSMNWKTTRGGPIKSHHINTIVYPRGSTAGNNSKVPKTTAVTPVGTPRPTQPSAGQETAENGDDDPTFVSPTLEFLSVDERRALPGYVDEAGVPIRPQGARLELFKASRLCYKLALKDYQDARARGFDRCKGCGTTHEGLLRRVQQGIRMADGLLVSAEGSEERAARVQITQLNFHMGGAGDDPSDPDGPEAASEPVLNVDLVRLLGQYLGINDLSIEGFFAYVQQERTQA